MHTIKITPNLLFEYQCTSGKFVRLPNRTESNRNFFCPIGMLYRWHLSQPTRSQQQHCTQSSMPTRPISMRINVGWEESKQHSMDTSLALRVGWFARHFYMPARHNVVVVCLSVRLFVRHKPVLYRNDWTNRAGFGMDACFMSLYCKEIWVSLRNKDTSVWNYVPDSGLRNFATTRSCCQQSSSTDELVHHTYDGRRAIWLKAHTFTRWLGSRVVCVLDSGAEGPGSNRSRDAVR